MLYAPMPAKPPPPARRLVAPPASGAAALRLPAADDLPPPYVDERLVEPETREEILHGHLVQAIPANPEHGDEHTELDFLARGYAAPGHTVSTDLLTRTSLRSDFATDTCIRRSGIDPRTGSRYLEELAFEVVHTQSRAHMVQRAHDLAACGVRRVLAVVVQTQEVCEWHHVQGRLVPLDLDGAIEDRTLVRPLPIQALFDAAVADAAVIDAMHAKGNPRLTALIDEGETRGLAQGRVEAIEVACKLLRIPLGPRERAHLHQLDAEGLATLLTALETECRWPMA